MWGRNYSQSSGTDVSVNTTLRMEFCELSQLRIGAWNQQLSIQIRPCIGVDGNGIRQYDQKRRGQTSLTIENSDTLYKGIMDYLLPAYEKIKKGEATLSDFKQNPNDPDEPINVAVQMGSGDKRNALAISIENDQNGNLSFYMHLYTMLRNDNTVDPANVFDYKFSQKDFMKNYNPKNGTGTIVEWEADFSNFVKILKEHVNLLPIAEHGTKYENAVNLRFRGQNQQQAGNDTNGGFNSSSLNSYSAPVSSYSGSEGSLDFVPFN